MAENEALSWREQLKGVRNHVIERQEQRATEKRLQRERNETSLGEKLKEDTPEALNHRANEIRKVSDRAARRFYPLPHIEAVLSEIGDFGALLRFYADCMKPFGKLFSQNHRVTITKLLGELGTLQRGLDRQLAQWRSIHDVMQQTSFRPKQSSDDAALVETAKTFSTRAHNVPLSIPGDFYTHETENFWVIDCAGTVLGHIKYWPEDKVITFALSPDVKVNFNKFVRGILHKFYSENAIPESSDAVRVRIGFVREVKFFTDMGFVRGETKGPSDWIYHRELS